LENCRIQALYPCHCVSLTAKAEMMRRLPVTEVGVGLKIIQND
jgi:7,8-dihydropterin-6-yl-methyl-4-(beta-D-ribofuranosyl)aminobenzene 5'-phosphate synthase